METEQKQMTLLEQAEQHLRQLSSDRLRTATEFLAFLAQQEKTERETRQQQFLKAVEQHQHLLEQFKDHTWPPHPDSVTLIRQMREGDEYRG
ncbi:MAG: hypothetical protein KME26_14920 [Oscillatoria princeps RMCB-10]|jgi:ATP-dependent protease HslVU (ClpYQ) peptidase subunit|nr:hypothetical protein [Oscillatoria princeps RMCB-10]